MKMAGMSQVLSHSDPAHARDSLLRLGKLRQEGFLCDLTILVQGQKFKAHKAVMAACSDYFFAAICGGKSSPAVSISKGPDGDHMTIELQYVTLRGFAPLLEYAYSSDLKVNASDVIDVLTAASYMQMFNVASACSDFMRSNLLLTQAQPRLGSLPPLARPLLNAGPTHNENGLSNARNNVLPEAVQTLLRSSRTNPLTQPPMLIPISSMSPYDVGLQQWVDTVAGRQNFLSRFVAGQSASANHSPASSMSPPSSPNNTWSGDAHSHPSKKDAHDDEARKARNASVSPKQGDEKTAVEDPAVLNLDKNSNNNNNNNNNSSPFDGAKDQSHVTGSSRKSVAVKLEPGSDDDMGRNVSDDITGKNVSSPSPGDAEDSWQSLQKLYSFQSKSDEKVTSGRNLTDIDPMSPSVMTNGLTNTAHSLQSVLEKMTERMPRLDGVTMVPRIGSVAMQNALRQQQQHFLASQQQQQQQQQQASKSGDEGEKMVADLPAVPPSGQYMSVRRRTLQSNVPKPHQCQICGSRFTRFHNLKQHIKLHSGIKPYECDECGKRFTRNYTLRLHKMKHVGMRNFKCGTCSASFTSLGEFRAHLRISMHSHMADGDRSPQPQGRLLEPEDLSGPHMSPSLLKFDPSMLRYGVGSPGSSGGGAAEGSTGTISPPGNSQMQYLGSQSPQFSDRSLSGSPQDLTTKRSSSDVEGKVSPVSAGSTPSKCGEEDDPITKRPRIDDYDHSSRAVSDDDEPMALVVDTSGIKEQPSPASC